MAYKMKGFSGFGNSPLKGKGDNLKRIMTENKIAAKKAGTWYAEGADPNKSSMPKDFNVKGSKGSTTPGYSSTRAAKAAAQDRAVDKLATRTDLSKVQFERKLAKITNTVNPYPEKKSSKMPKNFNVKGSSASTTPDYKSTKLAKAKKFKSYPGQELNEALKKAVNKNLNPKPKKIVHKGAVNIAKNVGRKVANIAVKRLGPLGAAITAYDVATTIPKVTKATKKGLKERAKSGNVNLGRKF
tara:strand:- start:8 stop:733 length:726 start_codon:yes stop_codon:yes gene_type:complete